MSLPCRAALALLLILCRCSRRPWPRRPASAAPLDLERVLRAKPGMATEDVTVDDPVYKRTMRYRGYPLATLLRRHYKDIDRIAAEGAELVLRAADGYAPSMDLAKALHGRGVIAFRDLNRTEADPWETFLQGKEHITPGALLSRLARCQARRRGLQMALSAGHDRDPVLREALRRRRAEIGRRRRRPGAPRLRRVPRQLHGLPFGQSGRRRPCARAQRAEERHRILAAERHPRAGARRLELSARAARCRPSRSSTASRSTICCTT